MASDIVTALGGDSDNGDGRRLPNPITHYKLDVADDSRGVPMLRLLAKHGDGTGTKYQNLLIYLDTPDATRALAAALPAIATAIAAIDAKQVALKAWPAAPAAAKPAAAPEQPAAPAQPARSVLSSAFDDLPW